MEIITGKEVQSDSSPMIIDKISTEHHEYFKYNVPVISKILNSTMKFDKNAVKNLDLIYKLFEDFKNLLEEHVAKDKFILFPVLQKLSLDGELAVKAEELKKMYQTSWNEISKLSSFLKQLKQLTNNYKPADNASQSLKQCFWDLQMLEKNCNQYVKIEKKYLLPKLIADENS